MVLDLENLNAYLAEHPYKFEAEDMDKLVDVLFWHYMEFNFVSSEELKNKTADARACIGKLTEQEADDLFGCFYLICMEYQRLAFTAGAQAGSRMALEMMGHGSIKC